MRVGSRDYTIIYGECLIDAINYRAIGVVAINNFLYSLILEDLSKIITIFKFK